MSFEQIVQSNIETFGILTFLSGLLLGNWLHIGRDRRLEFNEIADEIYSVLLEKRKGATSKLVWPGPTEDQFGHLKRRVAFYQARGLNKAISVYREATKQNNKEPDSLGQPHYKEPEKVVAAIDGLIKYVHRK